jgi:hypothetical protein
MVWYGKVYDKPMQALSLFVVVIGTRDNGALMNLHSPSRLSLASLEDLY